MKVRSRGRATCVDCGKPITPEATRCRACAFAFRTKLLTAGVPKASGVCGCGCGLPTPLAPCSNVKRGWVKGQPLWFIRGHAPRLPATKSYRSTWAEGRGTLRLHVLRAERALGKPLPPGAVVHHADGSKADDAPLVICQDQAFHYLLHWRMRVTAAGGNPNTESLCSHCRAVKPLAAFSGDRSRFNGLYGWCRACNNAAQKQRRQRKA